MSEGLPCRHAKTAVSTRLRRLPEGRWTRLDVCIAQDAKLVGTALVPPRAETSAGKIEEREGGNKVDEAVCGRFERRVSVYMHKPWSDPRMKRQYPQPTLQSLE